MLSNNKINSATIEATIVRADGTKVPLGIIAEIKKENILKKFIKFLKGDRK
jgi:hypothetical protein